MGCGNDSTKVQWANSDSCTGGTDTLTGWDSRVEFTKVLNGDCANMGAMYEKYTNKIPSSKWLSCLKEAGVADPGVQSGMADPGVQCAPGSAVIVPHLRLAAALLREF